eukprot:CAMPEP_0179217000 /NCGR_PEP_ID=MMETSP0797-20121207/3683_1 /TAXON_ID=47934 /ORGANISM="Dinophysis acuminata, Strain DAEP01" /LENGTH=73 /DNA_ID=CAMNT_0020923205 /DNA_START=241 /DNA_END=462 /DNA_ORIENTATION=+
MESVPSLSRTTPSMLICKFELACRRGALPHFASACLWPKPTGGAAAMPPAAAPGSLAVVLVAKAPLHKGVLVG